MAEHTPIAPRTGVKWARTTRRAIVVAAVAALAVPAVGSAADTPMDFVTSVTGAETYWQNGYTGKGVDIALIDTGVSDVVGLESPGKIMYGPDLSFDSQSPTLHQRDGFGHGTHLGSIIAGRDGAEAPGATYAAATSGFYGMAPDARLVNLKVGDAEGGVDVSQVIAAVDWVVEHRNDPGMNIRVLVLAYGTDSEQEYDSDPLVDAVAEAWKAGIVVVVAAGNGASQNSALMNPAKAPFVIAVGAADTKGTTRRYDDRVATFSSRGGGSGPYARDPDLVAPGVSILGLRVPGSYVDETSGASARKDERLFRGSGTSQAAAVVAGAAALLIEQRPDVTPDGVKALLKDSAVPLYRHSPRSQGDGELDLRGAFNAPTPWAAQAWIPTRGDGSLQAARGTYVLSLDGVDLNTDADIFGNPYDASQAAALRRAGEIWVGGKWRGIQMVGDDAVSASATLRAAATWNGRTWSGRSWSDFAWTGRSWQGRTWTGRTWAGRTWSGDAWAANAFTSTTWD